LLSLGKKITMRSLFLFLSSFLFTVNVFAQPQFSFQSYLSGLTHPLYITHAGDERMFVVEKSGIIKVVQPGSTTPTVFLNITSLVKYTGSTNSEQGLLGLAFHPDYKNNGYFYVNYTKDTSISNGPTIIARYSVSNNDSNVANPNSAQIILNIPQPFTNHNGGCLQFGSDGYLYIGMGDGGSANDPNGYGQDKLTLLGKMLRIDVNAATYSIPSTNPYYGMASARNEIWAYGLRNPWRFSFDRITQDLWMGDVGQNAWEELNFQPAASTGGENYGWRCYEGNNSFNTSGCPSQSTMVFPFYEYGHNTAGGYSVTGGYVYRSAKYKGAWGYYLFSDAVNQHLWATIKNNTVFNTTKVMNGTAGSSNVSFGQDIYGGLYIVKHSGGTVQRIVETGTKQPKAFVFNSGSVNNICEGNNYELKALYHPDLNYEWQKDGQTISGTNNSVTHFATESGLYRVIVSDPTVAQSLPDTSETTQVIVVPASVSSLQQNNYTVDVNDAAFQIDVTIQGGTFSGTGVDSSGLFTPSLAGLGTHQIVYTTMYFGCPQRDTATIVVTGTVGINDVNNNNGIQIFPNPNHGRFNVVSTETILKITVTDILGKVILSYAPNQSQFLIQTNETANGIYFVKIETGSGAVIERIFIE
jgi:glucose/arabinose dehydrogenase